MNIQTINNKDYIELDVVLLPTTDKTKLWLNTISNQLHYDIEEKVTHHQAVNQHIYFLSNKTPKEGDYWFDGTQIRNDYSLHKIDRFDRKVEATTDSSLSEIPKGDTYTKWIPEIPQQFIEHFITEFNKGNIITKMKVEVKRKIIGTTSIPFGYENIYSNDFELAINNVNNEVIPLIDVLAETPFHKPDFSHLKPKDIPNLAIELTKYINDKHTQEECIGFIDGFEKAYKIFNNKQ
jgi:hypothetical protein